MKQLVLERFESPSATALHTPAPEPDQDEANRVAEEARIAEEAAAAAAQEQRETAIGEAIRALVQTVSHSRHGAIQAFCSEVGDTVAGALPALLNEEFATETAHATSQLLEDAGIASSELHASPADAETIISILRRDARDEEISIIPTPELPDGQVRLSWSAGGANFTADTWAQEMQNLLKTRLSTLMNDGVDP